MRTQLLIGIAAAVTFLAGCGGGDRSMDMAEMKREAREAGREVGSDLQEAFGEIDDVGAELEEELAEMQRETEREVAEAKRELEQMDRETKEARREADRQRRDAAEEAAAAQETVRLKEARREAQERAAAAQRKRERMEREEEARREASRLAEASRRDSEEIDEPYTPVKSGSARATIESLVQGEGGEIPRFPDGRPATIANGAPSETGLKKDDVKTIEKRSGPMVEVIQLVNGFRHGRQTSRSFMGRKIGEMEWRLGWPVMKRAYQFDGEDDSLRLEEHYTVNGKPHGVNRQWYINGQLEYEIPWKNGLKDGTYKHWWETGELYDERNYVAGQPHGAWITWNKDGTPYKEVEYANGRCHGLKTIYYDNGQKYEETSYREGLLHGSTEVWYKDGNHKISGQYEKGVRVGVWQFWDEDGNERKEEYPEHFVPLTLKDEVVYESNGPLFNIAAVCFAPDSAALAIAEGSGSVHFWNVAAHQFYHSLQAPFDRFQIIEGVQGSSLSDCDYSPDGRYLAAAWGCGVLVWQLPEGRLIRDLWWGHGGVESKVGAVTFMPKGNRLISGAPGGHVIWDLRRNDVEYERPLVSDRLLPEVAINEVRDVQVSPSGSYVVEHCGGHNLLVWDYGNRRLNGSFIDETKYGPVVKYQPMSMAVSPREETVAVESRTGVTWVDLANGEEGRQYDASTEIQHLAYSRDGRFLALAGNRQIQVLDARMLKPLRLIEDTGSDVRMIAVASNGRLLATAHDDNKVRIWAVEP